MMKRSGAALVVAILMDLASGAGTAEAKELAVDLRYTPTGAVNVHAPSGRADFVGRPVDVLPLTDGRTGDPSVIGENTEHSKPVVIRGVGSVRDFSTQAFATCFSEWVGKPSPGAGLVLEGEILRLFVGEKNVYAGEARIRFKLKTRAGETLWDGVVAGGSRRWGRSLSADNYREVISDSLREAYAKLFSEESFLVAWSGKPLPKVAPAGRAVSGTGEDEGASGPAMTPAELRAKLVKLMGEGFTEDLLVGFVRQTRLSEPISTDEMIEWRRAKIPDVVLRAALERGSREKRKD